MRDICTSRTYQLSTQTNETNAADDRNFSHATLRRIRAEILLDCISQATETKDKFAGLPLGARAVQIADGNTATYFLTTFGRATRETVCSCEVKMEPNLGQALHLMNGENVHAKIKEGGVVAKLLGRRERRRSRLSTNCICAASAASRPPKRLQSTQRTAGRRHRPAGRSGRRVLGTAQFTRVLVQPLS